jgi:hypothetical protein
MFSRRACSPRTLHGEQARRLNRVENLHSMSIAQSTRRSGLSLFLLGIAGALFFWISDPDPRHGLAMHRMAEGRLDWHYWLYLFRGSPQNFVDAANQARMSTVVGVAGSLLILAVGLGLLSRRGL